MDAQRFDNLAKTLADRFSRRNALRRASAAATASVLAAAGLRDETTRALAQASTPTPAAGTSGASGASKKEEKAFYTRVRRYTLDRPAADVRKALEKAYLEGICNAPGFVAFFTVEDDKDADAFATVIVFRTKKDYDTFEKAETPWLAKNVGSLLPAPDDTVTGASALFAGDQQAFRNTCPGKEVKPAAAQQGTGGGNKPAKPAKPGGGGGGGGGSNNGPRPTQAPAQPTAIPGTPTPTEEPACRDQGCACTTGTRRPCKGDLVCCPTGDTPGGPGICQPQSECTTSQCIANDSACPSTCAAGADCADCCSGYCVGSAVCGAPPTTCTGAGCECTTGAEAPCDEGLVCCASGNTLGGPGTCMTEAECNPPCTGVGCACNGGVQGACDAGLVCCQEGESIPGGPGTCQAEADCAPPPCTGEGCACNGGVEGACDAGLICCVTDGTPGGPGTCQTEAVCNPPACTDSGIACPAACNWGDSCASCCSGFCNTSGICGEPPPPPTCTRTGFACDATCNWGDACASCCSGFCDANGVCNEAVNQEEAVSQEEPVGQDVEAAGCTGEGCACVDVCDEGLICCAPADGSDGPSICQVSC
ncbi:MAG: hypothetical protein IT338_12060 [Thermomicrobiales bacterium]|nr:hypothetical protein [Thermomicrobiales bacterium]